MIFSDNKFDDISYIHKYLQITNFMIFKKNYYCFYKKLLLFHIHMHFLKNY